MFFYSLSWKKAFDMGDMAKKWSQIYSILSISIIITINVKFLFLSSLKADFCSNVKVTSR